MIRRRFQSELFYTDAEKKAAQSHNHSGASPQPPSPRGARVSRAYLRPRLVPIMAGVFFLHTERPNFREDFHRTPERTQACGANGNDDWRASRQSGKVLMSNTDQFWQLARELRAAHSKTKRERERLIERARTWRQADRRKRLVSEQDSAQVYIPRKPTDTSGG
jgi:hypothetical protein